MSPTLGVTRRQVWSLTWSVNRFGSTWGEFIFGIRFIVEAMERGHPLHEKVERRVKKKTAQTAYFIDEGNVFKRCEVGKIQYSNRFSSVQQEFKSWRFNEKERGKC